LSACRLTCAESALNLQHQKTGGGFVIDRFAWNGVTSGLVKPLADRLRGVNLP
jgi:hypothetical protein